eukprot:2650027-Amphidinium_carterae.1
MVRGVAYVVGLHILSGHPPDRRSWSELVMWPGLGGGWVCVHMVTMLVPLPRPRERQMGWGIGKGSLVGS